MKKSVKSESGWIMLEASFVVTIVMICVAILIVAGFMSYQRTLVNIVANDTATSIAEVYSETVKDPFCGYIDSKEFYKTKLYRYLRDAISGNLKNTNIKKAKWYADYRLSKNSFWKNEGYDIDVKVQPKKGKLFQNQIVVTVSQKFNVPFVSLFGIDRHVEYKSTAYADCVDYIDYFNTISLTVSQAKKLEDAILGKETTKLISTIDTFINNYKKTLNDENSSGGGGFR